MIEGLATGGLAGTGDGLGAGFGFMLAGTKTVPGDGIIPGTRNTRPHELHVAR
jgi:hypothetical protein